MYHIHIQSRVIYSWVPWLLSQLKGSSAHSQDQTIEATPSLDDLSPEKEKQENERSPTEWNENYSNGTAKVIPMCIKLHFTQQRYGGENKQEAIQRRKKPWLKLSPNPILVLSKHCLLPWAWCLLCGTHLQASPGQLSWLTQISSTYSQPKILSQQNQNRQKDCFKNHTVQPSTANDSLVVSSSTARRNFHTSTPGR